MAESPSQAPSPTTPVASDADTTQYWCHHCDKRVSIETLANLPDVICHECKNGFVESLPAALPSPFDDVDDLSIGSQFLQVLRLIAQVAREEDASLQQSQDPQLEGAILQIELDESENDEEDDDVNDNEENRNGDEEAENENEDGEENDGREDRSDNENEDVREIDDVEDLRRRRPDVLRLRIRDLATRPRTGRNWIPDRAEIPMGFEDDAIEWRLGVLESDRYIGNPEDYVDAAGYEQLLQNLAESDGGRRGSPPASKLAVLELPTVEILSEQETILCAVCKDMVNVGGTVTKLPCGHGYHGDCIVPWLDSRNSCPVCRFELPTDDPEYEEERKKRLTVKVGVGGASGSAAENSSSG